MFLRLENAQLKKRPPPEKALPAPVAQPPAAPSLAPELEKYLKMTKMKIPSHAVQNKMRQDGIDPDERWQEIQDFLNGNYYIYVF